MTSSQRSAIIGRLVAKTGVRSEATIQSDVRMLLLDPELGLADHDMDVQLETHVGDQHRRIDVETGRTVIEVKRSLSSGTSINHAVAQLTDYVVTRTNEVGQRYVGILTDGRLWIAYHEHDGQLAEATRHQAVAGDQGATGLLRWLEGVLATRKSIPPTPDEIADRLGASSSSHAVDHATLAALYADHRDLPTVVLKRDLWANLLRSALGTQFTDSDELFLEHTLLVNSAEIIAHLVLGLDAENLSPATLLSGDQFAIAGLYGVVDRDFFDWVLEVPGGSTFVTGLARRLARFDWSHVEHDVLKVLYESVIPAETRKLLGEYYTPDWLANQVIGEVVTDPLNQRVLDPSCGSGTFVFYAVRRYLAAAEVAGVTLSDAMNQVSSRVIGIDLHPVAVALARVTYLLALGRRRLNATDRGTLSVPIYLGDSLGWDQREDLMSVDQLVIPTEVADQLLPGELRFPEHLLSNSAAFDDLVQSLVDESGRAAGRTGGKLSEGTIRRLAIADADVAILNANFARLKELHEAKRNHVWSYYIRNVSRPAWLARDENRVDILVGNPPWLSYRHMTPSMQARFKALAQDRGFWHNETTATHQDLAGLFVARAVERYLRAGGRFGFVVPNSVVDRDYWGGFRRGLFDGAHVSFTPSWDLRRVRPHLFPRGSAVIFGRRGPQATPMPTTAIIWSGRAPHRHAALDTAHQLRHALGELSVGSGDTPPSPYKTRFANGANLFPRMLFRVEPITASALGVPAGRTHVKSRRSVAENKPWKEQPDLTGMVETQFLRPTILGEQILPFRVMPPEQFVIPLTTRGDVLSGDGSAIDAYPGLATWVRAAEALWNQLGGSKMTLAEQIDHMGKLRQQVPAPSLRVVYAASGMHIAAALLDNPRVVVEHAAYWAAVATEQEGHYLVGILNSPILTELTRPLMAYGKDERHIDKNVWKLPIPSFDPTDERHQRIAELARDLAATADATKFTSNYFVTQRQQLRQHTATSAAGTELNELVAELLDADLQSAPTVVSASADLITVGSSELPLADIEIDVDAEFDHHGVYLWGATITRDGTSTYQAFGAPHVDEQGLAHEFASWLIDQIVQAQDDHHSVRWFHYGHAETLHLARLVPELAAHLAAHGTDLLAFIRSNHFSANGYGLKTLGALAGASWRTAGATGADTITWVEQARAGDPHAWNTLIAYNEDDTTATLLLRRHLRRDGSTTADAQMP